MQMKLAKIVFPILFTSAFVLLFFQNCGEFDSQTNGDANSKITGPADAGGDSPSDDPAAPGASETPNTCPPLPDGMRIVWHNPTVAGRTVVKYRGDEILVYKMPASAFAPRMSFDGQVQYASGNVSAAITNEAARSRMTAKLSRCPGDVVLERDGDRDCLRGGVEVATVFYSTDPARRSVCNVAPGTTWYANFVMTTCNADQTCGHFLTVPFGQ